MRCSLEVAPERLARIQGIKIRLLGDAVLRRTAWNVADQLGWAYEAEYLTLTKRHAEQFVATATLETLTAP